MGGYARGSATPYLDRRKNMDTNATNRTANYGLPKFIASDKPAWLVDWNNTMDELDRIIKAGDPSAMQEDLDAVTDRVTTLETEVASMGSSITRISSDINDPTTGIKARLTAIETDLSNQNTLIQQLDQRVTALENA